jgi:hypothetical protein
MMMLDSEYVCIIFVIVNGIWHQESIALVAGKQILARPERRLFAVIGWTSRTVGRAQIILIWAVARRRDRTVREGRGIAPYRRHCVGMIR